jgi:hypothetical protein
MNKRAWHHFAVLTGKGIVCFLSRMDPKMV